MLILCWNGLLHCLPGKATPLLCMVPLHRYVLLIESVSCLGLQAVARLKEKCGNTQPARQAYRRAIVVNPEHAPAYVVSPGYSPGYSPGFQYTHLPRRACRTCHTPFVYIGFCIFPVSSCCVWNLLVIAHSRVLDYDLKICALICDTIRLEQINITSVSKAVIACMCWYM